MRKSRAERDHHAGIPLVGDEQVAAPADGHPRHPALLAYRDQALERSDGGHLHVETRGSADAVHGMPSHGLRRVHVAVERVVDEQRLERRGMAGGHRRITPAVARRRRPPRKRVDELRADGGHVSRAHGDQQVALAQLAGEIGHHLDTARHVGGLGMTRMVEHHVQERLARHAGDGRFAAGYTSMNVTASAASNARPKSSFSTSVNSGARE